MAVVDQAVSKTHFKCVRVVVLTSSQPLSRQDVSDVHWIISVARRLDFYKLYYIMQQYLIDLCLHNSIETHL